VSRIACVQVIRQFVATILLRAINRLMKVQIIDKKDACGMPDIGNASMRIANEKPENIKKLAFIDFSTGDNPLWE
jgi:hypothetical protein